MKLDNVFTDTESFSLIKDRAHQLLTKDNVKSSDIDYAILPWLLKLNQHRGIATLFSCSGHPERITNDLTYQEIQEHLRFQLMMGVKDMKSFTNIVIPEFERARAWYKNPPKEFKRNSRKDSRSFWPTVFNLTFSQRTSIFDTKNEKTYNIVEITGPISNSLKIRDEFFKHLSKSF